MRRCVCVGDGACIQKCVGHSVCAGVFSRDSGFAPRVAMCGQEYALAKAHGDVQYIESGASTPRHVTRPVLGRVCRGGGM